MDIATIWSDDASSGEYHLEGGALVADQGLKTAVLLSLFTDRRAAADDVLPAADVGRRGWWGGEFLGRPLGSRLWLLAREKEVPEVLNRAREYALEALAWMVEDGVAQSVEARASYPVRGLLFLQIEIRKPDGDLVTFRFRNLWDALLAQDAFEDMSEADRGFKYDGSAAYDGTHDYSGIL